MFVTTSFIHVAGGGTLSAQMTGNPVGPCPRCQVGMGRVPDGRYDFTETATRILLDPSVPVADLVRLRAALTDARQRGADAAEVARAVKDAAPGAAAAFDWLLSERGGVLAAWLSLLIALLGLAITARQSTTTMTPEQVEEIVEQAKRETAEPDSSPPDAPPEVGYDPVLRLESRPPVRYR